MDELTLTFTIDVVWLAVMGGALVVLILWLIYSRWPRRKQRRELREFEPRERN